MYNYNAMAEEIKKENVDNQEEKKQKHSGIKYLINILLVLAVTFVAVLITLFSDPNAGPQQILATVRHANWMWIGIAFLITFFAILIQGVILFFYARLYTRKYHVYQGLAVNCIGIFYNAVTPGASGGQVMEAYTYKKQGVPISAAASIMVMQGIVYQIVLIIYGILAITIKSETIFSIKAFEFTINGYDISLSSLPLIIIGFGLNLFMIVLLFGMSYWKRLHNFILGPLIGGLAKIKIVKNPDKSRENLRIQVENFKIELKRLFSNIPFLILVLLLNFIVMTCNFSLPFFVGKALGSVSMESVQSFWDVVFFSNFHQMIAGIVPIPGAAGISEYFYNQLFATYMITETGESIISASQLIWRTISFTIPLIVGGFVSAFYRASPKEEARTSGISHQTFVSIQHETFIERSKSAEEAYQTMRLTRSAIKESLKKRNAEDRKKRLEKKKLKEAKAHSKDEYDKLDINDYED